MEVQVRRKYLPRRVAREKEEALPALSLSLLLRWDV